MSGAATPPRRRRRRARGQRGIALLAVITAVAICMVIVNEFGTRTSIDLMQARNNLDQMRAHFLARSSLNLTEIVLRLQDQIDKNSDAAGSQGGPNPMAGVNVTMWADTLMAAFGGDAEQVEAAIGIGVGQGKGLGSDIGTFGVRLVPVDGKININCSNNIRQANLVARTIETLLFPVAFDPLFQEPDADGWRRDRRTQVAAIIDYVDSNNFKIELVNDQWQTSSAIEDYGYETLRDRYKPKNNYLDSVSELKLVRGVDDRFWTLFGKAFRAHGDCKVNLRALDDPKVVAAIISLAAKNPDDPGLRDPNVVWTIANLVLKAKEFGYTFETAQEFAEFVGDPVAQIGALVSELGGAAGGSTATPTLPLPQLPAGFKGIELDESPQGPLNQIASSKSIEVYEVEAYAEIPRPPFLPIRRTIRSVWDQKHQISAENRRSPFTPNGYWLYLREE